MGKFAIVTDPSGVGFAFWEYGKVNFEVGYRTRDSNIEGKDYDDTFTLLTLDLDYPF